MTRGGGNKVGYLMALFMNEPHGVVEVLVTCSVCAEI